MPTLAADLYELLQNPRCLPAAHHIYHGYVTRKDAWGHPRWERDGRWFVFHAVQFGEIRLDWQGQQRVVTPGQCALFGARARPSVQWSQHVEEWDLHFTLADPFPARSSFEDILIVQTPHEAPGLIEQISLERLQADGNPPPLLRPRLALLCALLRAAGQEVDPERKLTPGQRLRLVRWTRAHLADAPTPADLAAQCNLSLDYFSRLFRHTFGLPPRQWLARERIHAARRLIDEEGLSPQEAMRRTGFRNPAHFSRLMKQTTGLTPSGRPGWRQRRAP